MPDAGRQPDPTVGVEHRVVRVGRVVPDRPLAEVAPGPEPLRREHRRHLLARDAERDLDHRRVVFVRVGHQQVVVADVDAVDRSVGIDPRVPLVGRDLVMDERDVVAPVPHRDDDVPLDALGTGRRFRRLAAGYPVGPVNQHVERALLPEPGDEAVHQRAALSALGPIVPGGARRIEIGEVGNLASTVVTHLVTALAPLQVVDPVGLRFHRLADAVALRSGAGEFVRLGQVDERQPVVGGVDQRCLGRRRRNHRGQLELVAWPSLDGFGVDQAVAPHPDVEGRFRKFRQEVAPVVIRDDDLPVDRFEIVGLGNHPDARFRSRRAGDPSLDHAVVGLCLGAHRRGARREQEGKQRRAGKRQRQAGQSSHGRHRVSSTVSPASSRSRATVSGHAFSVFATKTPPAIIRGVQPSSLRALTSAP